VERHAQALLAEGLIADPLREEPLETRLYKLYAGHMERAPLMFRPELHLTGLFDLFFHPRLLDIVEALLGPEIRLYPNYSCRPKYPEHAPDETLWHQDAGYTHAIYRAQEGPAESLRMVNAWTSLVPARVENGCMQFIPGTHTLGVVRHERQETYLRIAEAEIEPRRAQIVNIPTDPGDVVLFSNLLFHHGQMNHSDRLRWSFDWRYQDATQPTLRAEHGHIARNRRQPHHAVADAEQWASLSFR
jgi:hypothetical protein